MMLTAAIIRELIYAGLEGDSLVAACERIELASPRVAPAATARQARNARYYDNQKAKKEASDSDGLKTVKTVSDAIKTPPSLSLNDPLPNLVTVEVSLNPTHPPIVPPPSRKADLAQIERWFEELRKAYPRRGKASDPRKPAFEKFVRLIREGHDPAAIIGGAGRYEAIERAAGRAGTDKIAQVITWLNQHRWQDYPEIAEAELTALPDGSVHLMAGTEESEAWAAYNRKSKPLDPKGGWWYPSRWPPGHNAKREEPKPLPLEDDPFGDDVSA